MNTQKNRLSKVIAAAGVASRRAAETLIFEGKVKVNGRQVLVPQTMVDIRQDRIEVDGNRISSTEQKKYFAINKPKGYVCTNLENKKTVVDLFIKEKVRLFTVGRLDRDTTGLLFVTNDGHFSQQVIHPSFGVKKEYVVKVTHEIMPRHLKLISEGCEVQGVHVRPYSVKKVRKGTLKIIVTDGKKHEVRELVAHAGLKLVELKRTRIGSISLGTLPLGHYREITDAERLSFAPDID